MHSSNVPESPCPKCGYLMDAATFIGDGQVEPKVGDVGFCCACGLALLYGPGMIVEECPEAIQQKAAKILAAMQKARLEVQMNATYWPSAKKSRKKKRFDAL